MKEIRLTRRVTTPFLQAVPPQIQHFDAFIYAVVKRRPGKDIPDEKYGVGVRLDPCILDWTRKTITITIPLNINTGIMSVDDLDSNFYEAVEAGFLALMQGCLP
jgi:hypothetical protein